MRLNRLCGLVSLATVAASPVGGATLVQPVSVEPLVGLVAGNVGQCGIRAKFQTGSQSPRVLEVALERDALGSNLAVRLRGAPASATIAIQSVQSLPNFAVLRGASWPELLAPANDPAVTEFLQQMMIVGLRIAVAESGKLETLTIDGPVTQSVRAAYLNCAGDLYRPVQ